MKAVAMDREQSVRLVELDRPVPTAGQVLVRTDRAGVCATDREIARTEEIYSIPPGASYMMCGREASGTVVRLGAGVREFMVGDVVVPVMYGDSTIRGINDHGYFQEFFVDSPEHLVRIPPELADVAVLLEPLTVSVKAFTEAKLSRQR